MNVARSALQGLAGGLLGASLLGLVEACWLVMSNGAPDLWAPCYAIGLYGLIGAPIGLIAGLVAGALSEKITVTDERAFAIGSVSAVTPIALFVLRYVVNKEVFAEQGIPLVGNLAILAVIAVVVTMVLLAVPAALRGFAKPLTTGPGSLGAFGGLFLITLIAALVYPSADPRGAWTHGKTRPEGKPNVLFIMVDTLRADRLGAYGSKLRTPTMDALAKDGVLFENDFANASWTRASGASLMTSRVPSSHGAATKAARLPDEVVTWSEVLQPAGYATGALIDNINLSSTFNFDQGYDTFIYEAPDYSLGGTESVFGLTLYKVVYKVHEKLTAGHKVVTRYYQPADVVLGDAKGFIEANPGGFALFVHLMEPHDPYFEHPSIEGTGPDEYNGVGFARAEVESPDPSEAGRLAHLYDTNVEFLDVKLAPFVQWLKDSGHYDDTLIVLTADHGEEFAEHGGFWHGTTLYDEQIHVPLIVKLPKSELGGTRIPWQVRGIDVAPTIAGAAGVAPGAGWMGKDLMPDVRSWLVAQIPPPPPEPEPMPGQIGPDGQAIPLLPFKIPSDRPPEPAPVAAPTPCDEPTPWDRKLLAEEDFEGNVITALRDRRFKYIATNANNRRGLPTQELFEVSVDAGEKNNLVGSSAAVCGKYPESFVPALDEEAKAAVQASKSGSVSGGNAQLTPEDCERLKQLGYLDAATDCAHPNTP